MIEEKNVQWNVLLSAWLNLNKLIFFSVQETTSVQEGWLLKNSVFCQ